MQLRIITLSADEDKIERTIQVSLGLPLQKCEVTCARMRVKSN